MTEDPKNIWKKSWTGLGWLRAWLAIVVITFFTILIVTLFIPGTPFGDWPAALCGLLIISAGIATIAVGLWVFIRWGCHWRNLRRFLFVVACLVTLIALFYAEEDLRGKHTWETYKHQLEARGQKLDFSDFIPPSVPDGQNFAMTPIVSSSYDFMLTRDGKEIPYNERDKNYTSRMDIRPVSGYENSPPDGVGNWQAATMSNLKAWQRYYRALTAKTNEFPVPVQPQTPAADVLLALSKYDSTIEELRQAAQMPYSRFPLNYDDEDPAEILLPHLAPLKGCSMVLQLRALAELQNDQPDQACNDVHLMFRLADSIQTEPFIITHLVRIAIVQNALQPIYEGLAAHRWPDAQLAKIDSDLARLDFPANFEFSVNGERAAHIKIVAWLNQDRGRLRDIAGDMDNKARSEYWTPLFLAPSGWFYQNDLTIAKLDELWLSDPVSDEQQIVPPRRVSHAEDEIDQGLLHIGPYSFFARLLVPALSAYARKTAYAQNAVNMARVAIALERYHLVHGEFPSGLDALSPQLMAQVPHDIINGLPLHYQRKADGQFILYSIGWNETDDGGSVIFSGHQKDNVDITQGDWVWQYPEK